MEGVDDKYELSPGAFIPVNGLRNIALHIDNWSYEGIVTLSATGLANITVWTDPQMGEGDELTGFPLSYATPDEMPDELWVEGCEPGDASISLSYEFLQHENDAGKPQSKKRTDTVGITIYRVNFESLTFTSDHGLMNNNNNDWTDPGTVYAEPEWLPDGPDPNNDPDSNNPISHTKNSKIGVKAKVKIEPADLKFDLTGDGPHGYLDFVKTGNNSSGASQELPVTANDNLPNAVSTLSESVAWTVKLTDPEPDITTSLDSSGPHKIYVTYGTPAGSVVTEMRISHCCQWANNAGSPETVADGIHNALGDPQDPPYEPGEKSTLGSGWILMAGQTYGECDEQAGLMQLAVQLLGSSASIVLVRASTNAGEGNCLDFESRNPQCPVHGAEKLLLDFSGIMNQFEGCCVTANHYYAVWPKEKATNDYTMLRALGDTGATQHYCWWDNQISWWHPCDQPNSTPDIP